MTPDPPTQDEHPARVAIPEALAADVAARPEAYRPAVRSGDEVFVLSSLTGGYVGPGTLPPQSRALANPWCVTVQTPALNVTTLATALALVGSVDGGPRPEPGDRVLILDHPDDPSQRPDGVRVVQRVIDAPSGPLVTVEADTPGFWPIIRRWALLPPAESPSAASQGAPGTSEPAETVSLNPLRTLRADLVRASRAHARRGERGQFCATCLPVANAPRTAPDEDDAALDDGCDGDHLGPCDHPRPRPRRSLVETLMGDREVPPYVPRPEVTTPPTPPGNPHAPHPVRVTDGEEVCGVPSVGFSPAPVVACTYPRGHGPLVDRDGTPWEHGVKDTATLWSDAGFVARYGQQSGLPPIKTGKDEMFDPDASLDPPPPGLAERSLAAMLQDPDGVLNRLTDLTHRLERVQQRQAPPDALIEDIDGRVVVTWPDGKGDIVHASTELVESWAAYINTLRAEREEASRNALQHREEADRLREALTALLDIAPPDDSITRQAREALGGTP